MFIQSSSPHSPELYSWTDKNFINNFERGHFRNISVNWEMEATNSVVLIDWVSLLNYMNNPKALAELYNL